ncbi:MAG: insulinase family protein [Frankiaceae bacterium]|nr:insulinase family protein [Frankiaceae bacterium]MBV9870605.1 insulinase family protein [Frankiaceae bacterium]
MPVDLAGRDQRTGTARTLITAADGAVIRRTVLPGGLRVISESVPGVRSVAFGVWIGVGSRDESPSLHGASHYLEHLLFKGTKRRDALTIASALDEVGGELNAFTAKEYTCYYARVLDADLPIAVDVVCDMVTSSVLASKEVDNERGVILEEIAMHDDDPGDSVHDTFADLVWPDDPLGRPVLGSVDSIGAMTRSSIAGYYRRRYRTDHLVITAAGNVDHGRLVRLVKKAFADVAVDDSRRPAAPRSQGAAPAFAVGTAVRARPTEQANIVCGVPGLSRHDDRRFALGVLNAALGGGMSSRLFQEIREIRGLAYSVYSFATHYADTGMFGVYAGCHPDRARQVVELCREQLALAAANGLTTDELARGKGQMRGGLVLGLEDTGSRMSRLGKAELVYGELLTVEEVLASIDAVSLDDVQAIASEVFTRPDSLAVVGPYDENTAQFAA